MKIEIQKIIDRYEYRISHLDELILDDKNNLAEARKEHDLKTVAFIRQRKAIESAQRQVYVDVITDIDCLLDDLVCGEADKSKQPGGTENPLCDISGISASIVSKLDEKLEIAKATHSGIYSTGIYEGLRLAKAIIKEKTKSE